MGRKGPSQAKQKREEYWRRRRLGLCPRCGYPARGFVLCARHRAVSWDNTAAFRERQRVGPKRTYSCRRCGEEGHNSTRHRRTCHYRHPH